MIRFKVDLWDNENISKLEAYPNSDELKRMADEGVSFSNEEFITYGMFKEQKDVDGWRTYSELAMKSETRRAQLEEYFEIGSSVRSHFVGRKNLDISQTERIGVAAGLSIVSRLYGLTEADWEKIPEKNSAKTFDFEIAATEAELIEVECKGAVVRSQKKSEVSGAVGKIKEKKKSASGAAYRYGIVAAIPSEREQATIYVIDPESEINGDPAKIKLLSRLTYYYRELVAISRSPFSRELGNRIDILRRVTRYQELDGAVFLDRLGEELEIPASYQNYMLHYPADGVFGAYLYQGDGAFLFVGLKLDVVKILIAQNFKEIMTYSQKAYSTPSKNVDVSFASDSLPEEFWQYRGIARPTNKKIDVPLVGELVINSAGKALGFFTVRP